MIALLIKLVPYFLKALPWIAGVLVLLGIGGWAGHKSAQDNYDRLQGQYTALQLADAQQQAASQKAATAALQAQIAQRTQTEARNAQLQQSLATAQDQASSAQRSADFANRLLTAARALPAPAASHPVPAAASGQQPVDTSGPRDDRPVVSLSELIAGAATECRDAIQRFTALQLELGPQLSH